MSPVPDQPKIYHIVHVDRLPSIVAAECLLCEAEVATHECEGTTIGMGSIKHRRLNELSLESHPGLLVGQCVPFYFCPRSVMLYILHQGNHPDISYRGGQGPIVHLQADLHKAVDWAEENNRRWAFTLSNAGSYYFEDRADLVQLSEIDWAAVQAASWRDCKEGKQAEFLVEESFPWSLVETIGVAAQTTKRSTLATIEAAGHKPVVEIKQHWYY